MLVRKRSGGGGSILKRTSSITSINKELSNTEATLESPPSDNNSIDNTPHFLRTCRLCLRRLAAAQDIYMYRGDTAFCSLECREEQMKEDERKNNNQWKNNKKVSSMNKQQQDHPPPSSSATAAAKTHTTQLAAA